MRTRHKTPEIVIRHGKPAAVIVDIEEYRELLERLEDAEDLRELEKLRSQPQSFRRLEDVLSEIEKSV